MPFDENETNRKSSKRRVGHRVKDNNIIFQMDYLNPPPDQVNSPYQNLFFDNEFRICLNQLGKNRDITFHTHAYYEFELVVDGFGVNNIMSEEMQVSKGHFFFLSPSAFHNVNANPDSTLTIINFKLRNSFSEFLLKLFGSEYYAAVSLSEEETDGIREMLMKDLERSKDMPADLRRMYMQNTVKNILLIFAQHYYRSKEKSSGLNESSDLINKVILYIRQNYALPITLTAVSQKYGYSPNYISQMIRSATGMTFKNYVNHLRMQTAYNRILYQDTPFKQIARDVGYENYTSFLDVFMKKYNISPTELRSGEKKDEEK